MLNMGDNKLLCTLCLLLSYLACVTAADHAFTIEGRIYCDTCRAGFETGVTEYIEGAKVRMECKNFTSGEILHDVRGTTDSSGTYRITIMHDHDDEICEVVLDQSPREDCNEIKAGRDRARVVLTRDNGLSSEVRFANSLGFLKKDPLPACGQLLQMYALSDDLD